jgi:hypothetical protein
LQNFLWVCRWKLLSSLLLVLFPPSAAWFFEAKDLDLEPWYTLRVLMMA